MEPPSSFAGFSRIATNGTNTIKSIKSNNDHKTSSINKRIDWTRSRQAEPMSSLVFPALILLALTGLVCTYKQQNEGDCLSSVVLCYKCDSRIDPNCADPFDFSPTAFLEAPRQQSQPSKASTVNGNNQTAVTTTNSIEQNVNTISPNETNNINFTIPQRVPKKLPPVSVCHGCCVKLTSKLPDKGVYVMRMCTTDLQINLFMVGLVCMKESGDRGKMCFCETDYCNGQISSRESGSRILFALLFVLSTFISLRTTTIGSLAISRTK